MSSCMKSPEPIQIVGYNPDLKKYEFDTKAFAKIATSDEIKNLPIAVVSIIGDNRKGKSFLLNYFLRYLQRYDQEDWLGDPNEPLDGFSWKQGTEKVTVGMVLWPEPLVITKKDGTKIAVLLMDTQGLFDHQTKDENCMEIFVISSLLSSIQVYNKSNNIQSNDIIQLSQLIKYLKEKQKSVLDFEKAVLLEKPEKLWFLVRDWAFDCDHSFGADGGRKFLSFKKKNQSNKFEHAWTTIDECYSEVDCFLMPHPGLDAINNTDFKGETCKLEPDFVKSLRELVLNLLSPENIAIKTTEDKPMKFFEFLKLVEIFGTTFSGNDYIYDDESRLAIEYIARTIEAARIANEMFISKMVENSFKNNVDQFQSQLEASRWEAISFYLKETQSIDSEIMLDSLKDLEKSLKSHATSFERINSEVRTQPSSHPTLAVQRYSYKNLILLGARLLSPSFLFKLIRAHFTRTRR